MTSLIKIGNSQGIKIPRAIIKQVNFENKRLLFKVLDEGLLIKPVSKPGQGWKEQFDKAQDIEQIDQEWLDAPLVNDEEWEFLAPSCKPF